MTRHALASRFYVCRSYRYACTFSLFSDASVFLCATPPFPPCFSFFVYPSTYTAILLSLRLHPIHTVSLALSPLSFFSLSILPFLSLCLFPSAASLFIHPSSGIFRFLSPLSLSLPPHPPSLSLSLLFVFDASLYAQTEASKRIARWDGGRQGQAATKRQDRWRDRRGGGISATDRGHRVREEKGETEIGRASGRKKEKRVIRERKMRLPR